MEIAEQNYYNRPIWLVFSDQRVHNNDWIMRNGCKIISWYTGSELNHVDAVGPTYTAGFKEIEPKDELSTDLIVRYGAMPGDGVDTRPMLYTRSPQKNVHIRVTKEQYDKFYQILHSQLRKGYDYKAVWGWAAGLQDESVWFCSELITFALIGAGIIQYDKKHISPIELYDLVMAMPNASLC